MFEIHGFLEKSDLSEPTEIKRITRYLSMTSVLAEVLDENGNVNNIPKIETNTKTLLTVSNFKNNQFDSSLINKLLTRTESKINLIENIKKYIKFFEGVLFDFEKIHKDNLKFLIDFAYAARRAIRNKIMIISIGASDIESLNALNEITNYILITTFTKSSAFGYCRPILSFEFLKETILTAKKNFHPKKVLIGLAPYGIDYTIGIDKFTSAPITNDDIMTLSTSYGSKIFVDEMTQCPYFTFFDTSSNQHLVWFENTSSMSQKYNYIKEEEMGGISWWTPYYGLQGNWESLRQIYINNISKENEHFF